MNRFDKDYETVRIYAKNVDMPKVNFAPPKNCPNIALRINWMQSWGPGKNFSTSDNTASEEGGDEECVTQIY